MEPIAYIHTGYSEKFGIPRQSGLVWETVGRIVFEPSYRHPDAVRGIEQYSHLWLIWDFSENHRNGWNATVTPPRLGGKERVGVFASRSPFRPNPIGLSCVKLLDVLDDEKFGKVLIVGGADMLDGTPVYDIKPYLPYADSHPEAEGGFGEERKDRELTVTAGDEIKAGLGEEFYNTVSRLIAMDPRTAFIHDDKRVWGLCYEGVNVRFRVEGDTAVITEIDKEYQE
ncbi:MAG: tRNA (N6-threonylcarbamoyladenosine(37)-N6)-methyltransferase TrmO [Lachnospiraceae bacterium]|nr:tRNA (N6-threonylcarbamoyladenosine(37)-N6)-methyltransferase TrmO [Lachnospiraceae bacterium]